jgi:hypothetical protein
MDISQIILEKRDAKVQTHLMQYAPVWIIDQNVSPSDETVLFDAVFQHNQYGWVRRRYRYDAYNDVLYYKGQVVLVESEVLAIQEHEPFLVPTIADIPNAYGG